MPESRPPDRCANCGAELPPKARACPECGADERTGLHETSVYDGLDLPEPGHGGETNSRHPWARNTVNDIPWYWYAVATLLLASLALFYLGLR